jgi:hypothetical protein
LGKLGVKTGVGDAMRDWAGTVGGSRGDWVSWLEIGIGTDVGTTVGVVTAFSSEATREGVAVVLVQASSVDTMNMAVATKVPRMLIKSTGLAIVTSE